MIRLCDILREDLIVTCLEARSKGDVFEALVTRLCTTGDLQPGLRDTALAGLKEREREMSTGMEYGVAIPHAVVDGIDDVVAALGVSRQGVPFDSMDGWPAYIVVLLLTPPNLLQSHVRTLAGVARLLNDPRMRDSLRQAASSREAYDLIVQAEG